MGHESGFARGEEVVHISIRGPREEIEAKLEELNLISDFKRVKSDDGVCGYQIVSQKGKNTAEELFHFVVQNHWSLTELRQEAISLEDVFLELTGSESANQPTAP